MQLLRQPRPAKNPRSEWELQSRCRLLLTQLTELTQGGFRMPEAKKTDHPHIICLEGVCGGEPIIDGLRVGVRHVVTLHQRGETILDIAEALGIAEAQVFHALSYFFDHRGE